MMVVRSSKKKGIVSLLRTLAVAVVLLGIDIAPVYAYIDPNIGGLFYQILLPLLIVIAGAWAVFRQWISRILSNLWERLRGREVD
jgi:hypothetical protein